MTGDPAAEVLLEARDVVRSYRVSADVEVRALRGVSLTVSAGDYTAIVGTSGSGKSTLLNLLGALDRPTSGMVAFRGRDVRELSDTELAELRNRAIGFVFQSFHLLPRMSAVDNVALPLVYRSGSRRDRRRRAEEALAAVGLADRMGHRPSELSGGQQQRVAIARALVTEPDLVLADEPTGNLDTATGEEVMRLLDDLNRERGVAVVTITHDREVADHARRVVELRDGAVVADRVGGGRESEPDPDTSGRAAPGSPSLPAHAVGGGRESEPDPDTSGRAAPGSPSLPAHAVGGGRESEPDQ